MQNVSALNDVSTLVVSDIFEISGHFSQEVQARYDALDLRVDGNDEEKELVRYELELVCDLCTNTEESLSDAQLLRVHQYLVDKLDSVAK